MKKLLFLIIPLLLLASCGRKSAADPVERKVDSLLALMTIEEKIGQMNQLEGWMNADKEAQIRAGQVGAFLNVADPVELNRLQRIAVEESRLGIPLLFGRDVIHGFKTILPIPIGQAATWNPELVEQGARMTAAEATQTGIRWTFSPMVDIARDARWGRLAEGYGEDTYLTSVMGAATVRGYQYTDSCSLDTSLLAAGEKNNRTITGLAACVKHFAGYGASESGRDYNTTWIPEIQLRDVYLPPFKACADAGALSFMCSFNDINGLPSSANAHLNIDILRHEWGYDGLLVSDWGSGSDLIPHHLCSSKQDAAIRCLNARMEMDMEGHLYEQYAVQLLNEKRITLRQIDDCVRDILRMKFRLGLFDHPYAPTENPVYYSSEALDIACRTAEESTVLLKNNGVLPLFKNQEMGTKNKEQGTKSQESQSIMASPPKGEISRSDRGGENNKTIGTLSGLPSPEDKNSNVSTSKILNFSTSEKISVLVTGPLADAKKEQLGTWIFDGEPEHSVTPLMALSSEPGLRVIYEAGLTYSRDTDAKGIRRAVDAARSADVILFFCGEEAILSGEARCRADISLPGAQNEMMEALAKTGKPVVMIVMAGRPLTIGKQVEQAAAVLYAYHGGTMAGPALANILTGRAVPSGHLPMTMPQMVGQVPMYYNRHNTGRPATTPMLIGDIPIGCPQFSIGQSSYHLEVGDKPLFPFGYGLSYTTFEYGKTSLTNKTISCTVTNTGGYDAMEVVQLYVQQTHGDLVRPICELKGFRKVLVPAAGSVTVEFTLSEDDLAYWHEKRSGTHADYYLAADKDAEYLVWIAPDSRCQTDPVTVKF